MKLTLVALACTLLAASGAVGATKPKVIGTRGQVQEIAADGGRVAIHSATFGGYQCDSGGVWAPATGKVVHFQDTACPSDFTYLEYQNIALAGTRAAWIDYDTGNHVYCVGPMIATTAKPKPGDSGVCPDEPDNQDIYWEFLGDGSLLVARSYLDCEESCGPDFTGTYEAEVTLYTIGTRVKKLASEPRNTKLLDVDAGRILIRDGSTKQLVVLSPDGKKVGGVPVDATRAFMDGAGRVSVQSGTTLETYDAATGKLAKTCTMKVGAKVWDVENGTAVYSVKSELHLLTIATNNDRVVVTARVLADADLEPSGLYYAYNVPNGGDKPGRVAFIPVTR